MVWPLRGLLGLALWSTLIIEKWAALYTGYLTHQILSPVSALLASQGITGTPLVISGIISALFGLGAKSISGCDSNNKGIHLVVLWVGAPWCQPL
jgi:hypothetical protein